MSQTRPLPIDLGLDEPTGPPPSGVEGDVAQLRFEVQRLKEEVTLLRTLGAKRDAAARRNLPGSIVVTADQVDEKQGFHSLERTVGTTFRWTGPANRFFFELLIDRVAGADLLLHGINFIDWERQKGVTLLVDAEEVPLAVDKGGMGIVGHAVLPPRIETAPTQLVFVLPEMMTPDDPSDERELGLSFVRLTVTSRV